MSYIPQIGDYVEGRIKLLFEDPTPTEKELRERNEKRKGVIVKIIPEIVTIVTIDHGQVYKLDSTTISYAGTDNLNDKQKERIQLLPLFVKDKHILWVKEAIKNCLEANI